MKIQVQAAQLAEALSWILPAIKRNPTMPVLTGAMVTADEDSLTVAAFDYDLAMKATIPALVSERGQCLVGGRVLRDLSARMNGDVALVAAGSSLTLTCGRSNYDLGLMPTTDYPTIRTEAPEVGQVDAATLLAALHRIEPSIGAPDIPLTVLRGVHLVAEDGTLRMDASDRYRIARATTPYDGKPFDLTPDGKILIDIVKGLAGRLTLGIDDTRLVIADDARAAAINVMGDDFPKFDTVIDSVGDEFRASFERDDLLAALGRLDQIAEKKTDPIVLAFHLDGHCEVRSHDNDSRRSGVELIDCESTHDSSVAFNPHYLADALKVHTAETVALRNSDPKTQFKPTQIVGDDGVITIVTPINLRKRVS
ncbi:MAG TPA: DNA polymerase III subunit beta [Nocardioides sp.]